MLLQFGFVFSSLAFLKIVLQIFNLHLMAFWIKYNVTFKYKNLMHSDIPM